MRKWAQISSKCLTGKIDIPLMMLASIALSKGTTTCRCACRASKAIGSTPRTGRTCPLKANSPINSYCESELVGIWREAARIPKAIARSKRPPSLGKSAGAKLIVTRCRGNSN